MWLGIILAFLVGVLVGGIIVNKIFVDDPYLPKMIRFGDEDFVYDKSEGAYQNKQIFENVTVVIAENQNDKNMCDLSWYRQDDTKELTEEEWEIKLKENNILQILSAMGCEETGDKEDKNK